MEMTTRPAVAPVVLGTLLAWSMPALAHGGAEITERTAWSTWDLTPDIVIPTALLVAIYVAGMVRRRTVALPVPWWRHAMFFGGLGAVFVALQSPVDPIAERLFFVHQIQHFLLRMLGPMLLALSWPEGLLTAGLPAMARRTLLTPVISSAVVRRSFGFLAHPAIATALFIAALYAWEIPRYHDLALLNEPVHYLMHVTMLLAGLVFWWRLFDRRAPRSAVDPDDGAERWWRLAGRGPSAHGLRYGVRLMMLWLVILSNILLGAYTTLKTTVLYDAYDVLGRLYGYSALADEQLGGIIIWIPSSMMCLLGVLVIIHLWGSHEARLEDRRMVRSRPGAAALDHPTTAAALIARTRPKNRAIAIGFGVFSLTMFASAILIGVFYNMSRTVGTRLEARGGVKHAIQGAASPTLR